MSLKHRILGGIGFCTFIMSLISLAISGCYLLYLLGVYFFSSAEWNTTTTVMIIIVATSAWMMTIGCIMDEHYPSHTCKHEI